VHFYSILLPLLAILFTSCGDMFNAEEGVMRMSEVERRGTGR